MTANLPKNLLDLILGLVDWIGSLIFKIPGVLPLNFNIS